MLAQKRYTLSEVTDEMVRVIIDFQFEFNIVNADVVLNMPYKRFEIMVLEHMKSLEKQEKMAKSSKTFSDKGMPKGFGV